MDAMNTHQSLNRRQLLRVIGGAAVAAATAGSAGCSANLPAQALVAWQGPGAETDLRRWLLAHAILAPNAHNLQAWLVDLREPDVITLRIDLQRLLPQTDPLSRQSVISQGGFLELLVLAARQRGFRAEISAFPEGAFGPDGPDARPVARVQLLADASLAPDPLFAQIFNRHTNRADYSPQPPDALALATMRASVAGLPVQIGFTEPDQVELLQAQRQIAMAAWRTELVTPRTLLESYKVLRIGPDEISRHRDGLSLNDPLVRALTALGLFDRSQPSDPESSALKGQIDRFNQSIVATPAFCWLTTADNQRGTQLAAGRAWVRAQLAATAQGLSMHPLSQALQEYPEQAPHHAAIHGLLGATPAPRTVQMWARLGQGPKIQPSPRRGVDAHLQAG